MKALYRKIFDCKKESPISEEELQIKEQSGNFFFRLPCRRSNSENNENIQSMSELKKEFKKRELKFYQKQAEFNHNYNNKQLLLESQEDKITIKYKLIENLSSNKEDTKTISPEKVNKDPLSDL